ncbi:hypothetical protein [Roseomonas mucosa]|uniref:hypothetical protein n=1 Tax=Roseomonas mucosa TaxID=207340 RepID=UPI002B40475F|nr:hypothetical protein [Roseomonas mucosa]
MTLVIAQGYSPALRLPPAFSPSIAKLQAGGGMANWFAGAVANAAFQLATVFVPSVAAPLPAPVPVRAAAPVLATPKLAVSTARDMAGILVNKLDFPITALSDVLDVERKTIYDWLKKGSEAGHENAERLHRLVEAFAQEEPGSLRVFHRFWKRTLPDGSSLHEVLMAPTLEPERIRSALEALRPAVNAAISSDRARGPVSYEAPHPADLLSEYLEVGSR